MMLVTAALVSGQPTGPAPAPPSAESPRLLAVLDSVDLALERNRARPASRLSIEIAEAQLMESVMKAGYQKVLFDHAEARTRLDQVVGAGVEALLDARR